MSHTRTKLGYVPPEQSHVLIVVLLILDRPRNSYLLDPTLDPRGTPRFFFFMNKFPKLSWHDILLAEWAMMDIFLLVNYSLLYVVFLFLNHQIFFYF